METATEPDAYDKAVIWLTDHPDKIGEAWFWPRLKPGGILFQFCTPAHTEDASRDGKPRRPDGKECSCLTLIHNTRNFDYHAWTDELTKAIRADHRIPMFSSEIEVGHLQIFATWQRRIDRELGRTPPVWSEP